MTSHSNKSANSRTSSTNSRQIKVPWVLVESTKQAGPLSKSADDGAIVEAAILPRPTSLCNFGLPAGLQLTAGRGRMHRIHGTSRVRQTKDQCSSVPFK